MPPKSYLVLLLFFLMVKEVYSYQYSTYDPTNDASSTTSTARSSFSTSEDIKNNFTQPLSSSDNLKSFDGTPFPAQMSCPSNKPFLEAFAAPDSNGDITTLNIQQDTDNDGVYDYLFTPSFRISGICANGLISCDSGTWNNCSSYKWDADLTSNKISLIPANLIDLGGCACINNSCGSGLFFSNLTKVLSDLMGGAVGKLSQINPTFAVSDTKISNTVITYYGQEMTSCGMSGATGQEAYYNNPNNMQPDSVAQAPLNSMYTDLTTSPSGNNSFSKPTCSITRNVTINNPSEVCPLDPNVPCIGGSCTITYPPVPAPTPKCTVQWTYWDDPLFGKVWTKRYVAYFDTYPPGTSIQYEMCSGKDLSKCNVTCGTRPDYYPPPDTAMCTLSTPCAFLPDTISNSCTAYENNSDCQLESETIDGVTVYDRFSPTGATTTPSSKTFTNASCSLTTTRDWWEKKRTYNCQTNTYNLDKIYERTAKVKSSATLTGYDDHRLDETTGTWSDENGKSLSMPQPPPVSSCTLACKTSKPRDANDVALQGTSEDNRNSPLTNEIAYYECDTNNNCPAGAGETILKACQCINEFAEATAIMQAMREAGKDVICTTGTKSAP